MDKYSRPLGLGTIYFMGLKKNFTFCKKLLAKYAANRAMCVDDLEGILFPWSAVSRWL